MTEQQAATSTIGGHLGEAARNTGHAAREAARRARTGLHDASSAVSSKGLVAASREGAQAFWKSRPLATIGLAVGGTVLAAHVAGQAFAGNRQQKAASRDMSRGGREV